MIKVISDDRAEVGQYYDDFSQTYERRRHRGYHALVDDIEASLVLENYRGGKVLEVGCGTGLIMKRCSKIGKDLIGVDISNKMVEKAHRKGHFVFLSDVVSLPFGNEVFDLVYSFKVLAHVVRIKSALREIARVTCRGGQVLAEFYNPLSTRYLVKRIRGASRTGLRVTEEDVPTRWDLPWEVERHFPSELEIVRMYGVRVVTPAAVFIDVPVVGRGLQRIEAELTRRRIAARFGGFVVVHCQRR